MAAQAGGASAQIARSPASGVRTGWARELAARRALYGRFWERASSAEKTALNHAHSAELWTITR